MNSPLPEEEMTGSLPNAEMGRELPPMEIGYLLVITIPCHVTPDGARHVDPLWAKDIEQHLPTLSRLTIAAPRVQVASPPEGFVQVPEAAGLRFVDLDQPRPRLFAAVLSVIPDAVRIWKASGAVEILHFGVAGWPYPLGWLASPIAWLRGKKRVVIVESAPWRADRTGSILSPRRIIAEVYERLARWCVRSADVAIFTQSEYRDSMLGIPGRGWIIPASWIDEDKILTDEVAERSWCNRPVPPEAPLRLGFAGRLVAQKGVAILLDALRILDRRGVAVTVNLFGAGPLSDDCERVSKDLQGPTQLRMRGVLPYGPSFFEEIGRLHAILIPSLGDEQPRIVYDAWARAVPFLGSETPGLRDCASQGGGRLVPLGDASALADAIESTCADPAWLKKAGMSGLAQARRLTHQEMHRTRRRIFAHCFEHNYTYTPEHLPSRSRLATEEVRPDCHGTKNHESRS